MKTTVQALKELYATLGGDLADVALIERIPEMIEALNSIAVAVPAPTAEDEGKVMTVGEDGALGFADALPPVTSADAGKVLAVSDAGAWEAAAASGGGDSYVIKKVEKSVGHPDTRQDAGWTYSWTNVDIEKPSDYVGFVGVGFAAVYMSKSDFAIVQLRDITDNGNSLKIGTMIQRYSDNAQSAQNYTINFYYLAKKS